jgi:hypothetical protein
MPAVNVHFGRFADQHKIRPNFGISFHEGIGSNAVAPLLHVAEIVNSQSIQQAQITGDG